MADSIQGSYKNSNKRSPSSPAQETDNSKKANLNTSNSSMQGDDSFNEGIFDRHTDRVINALKEEMALLRQELKQRDELIASLEEKNKLLEKRIEANEDRIDDLEQYSRTNNVRISGIPEAEIENTDLIVINMAKAIGANVSPHDICRSHRVGNRIPSKPRNIIVKFRH